MYRVKSFSFGVKQCCMEYHWSQMKERRSRAPGGSCTAPRALNRNEIRVTATGPITLRHKVD